MKTIPVNEGFFQGAISFETGDGWVRPWRLPFSLLGLFPDENLVANGGTGAGVRVRLATNSPRVVLNVVAIEERRLFDVTIGGELLATVPCEAGAEQVAFDTLPDGEKIVELWLPQGHPVALRSLLVEDGTDAAPAEDSRPKWITYGSSITHCGEAHSPARTWPGLVARAHGLNLTCLGYGGQCHLDPLLAVMIRDVPADFVSLKVGVNIYGGPSLSQRTFRPAIIGFVRIIREKHPDIPIALISPICSPPRETTPNAVGITIVQMREQIRDVVSRLTDCGDGNVHYFDGLQLFGHDLAGKHLPDDLHPNGNGYEILGRNFCKVVMKKIPISA